MSGCRCARAHGCVRGAGELVTRLVPLDRATCGADRCSGQEREGKRREVAGRAGERCAVRGFIFDLICDDQPIRSPRWRVEARAFETRRDFIGGVAYLAAGGVSACG